MCFVSLIMQKLYGAAGGAPGGPGGFPVCAPGGFPGSHASDFSLMKIYLISKLRTIK